MKIDKFGQHIYSEDDICHLYLTNPEIKFESIISDMDISFPEEIGLSHVPKIKSYIEPSKSVSEFDKTLQNVWFMPESYKNMDIAEYILNLCKSDAELQRAGEELMLFQQREMFDLLKYLKYLVDTMRQNRIVWGVGRGSSVSSFVLFLIGVHKINSLYYDLSIDEFLK